jgi:hypothetical protein
MNPGYARGMSTHGRGTNRTLALATLMALAGFGLAGYGVVGSVPAANAILETTAQSPIDVLPRPSTAAVVGTAGVNDGRTAAPASRVAPLVAVLLVAGIGIGTILVRRRAASS